MYRLDIIAKLIHHEDSKAVEQAAQSGWAVSIHAGLQDPAG